MIDLVKKIFCNLSGKDELQNQKIEKVNIHYMISWLKKQKKNI